MKDFFNKINCSKIPFKDKGCHFSVGFILSMFMIMIFNIGLILTLVGLIAVGKELFDKYIRKTFFDLNDIVATLLGSIVFVTFFNLIKGHIDGNI